MPHVCAGHGKRHGVLLCLRLSIAHHISHQLPLRHCLCHPFHHRVDVGDSLPDPLLLRVRVGERNRVSVAVPDPLPQCVPLLRGVHRAGGLGPLVHPVLPRDTVLWHAGPAVSVGIRACALCD